MQVLEVWDLVEALKLNGANKTQEIHGVEVQCACHVFGSTALQRVLKHSNSSQRAALAAPLFSSPPRALLTDKYGSHAVEALLALWRGRWSRRR